MNHDKFEEDLSIRVSILVSFLDSLTEAYQRNKNVLGKLMIITKYQNRELS